MSQGKLSLQMIVKYAWWATAGLCLVASAGYYAGWPPVTVFIVAGIGTIPAAGLLGKATEEIARAIEMRELVRVGRGAKPSTRGAKIGGLLNATFGNIPELFIGAMALHQGYITLTKATIIGSVIGNAAFVLGVALFLGGIRNGTQKFDSVEAGHHAVLLVLAVAALILPSVYKSTGHGIHINEISLVAAGLLLTIYAGYILYSLFGVRRWRGAGKRNQESRTFVDDDAEAVDQLAAPTLPWPLLQSVGLLAVATIFLFFSSQALVDTVQPFTHTFGWSPFFVGIVVVPLLGNMAEQSSAIFLAIRNRTDTALGVASGSSIQVAVFVTPILVFVSQFGAKLNLVFDPLELAVLALVVVVFFFISQDGESNWLEGGQLIILYVLAATVFFFVPGHLR